jgi:hypothetical protein
MFRKDRPSPGREAKISKVFWIWIPLTKKGSKLFVDNPKFRQLWRLLRNTGRGRLPAFLGAGQRLDSTFVHCDRSDFNGQM